jgi:putative heme utilization carrier protein HutX
MDRSYTLAEYLKQNPGGTLEEIAAQYQTSLLEVVRRTPGCTVIEGTHFNKVWEQLSNWGKLTLVVNTGDVIFEYASAIPNGAHQRGYFNLQSHDGLSGHIKATACAAIAFVERKFMGLDTAVVIFLNLKGEAMLKIFLGRDKQRALLAHQLTLFRTLPETLRQ